MSFELLQIWKEWLGPAAEILLLGIAIYFAFSFVRGTRGAPVVTGFLVLLVSLSLLTSVLHLQVLSALLRYF